MANSRINWKLIIVILLAAAALALTMLGLRQWNRSFRARSGLKQGSEAFDAGRWEQAAAGFGQYLAVRSDDVPVWMQYAQAQLNIRPLRSEGVSQAVNAYRNILRKEVNSEAARRLITILLQVRLPSEGQDVAERFLQSRSDSEVRRLLALCLVQQKKYEEALEQMQNLIQEDPSQVLAYDILARISELDPKVSRFEPVQWFDRAVAANPASARAYILRGVFLLRQKKTEQAMADMEKAQQCDLSAPAERIGLAAGWLQAGKPEMAQKQLEQVFISDPANPALWQTWAGLAIGLADKERAGWVADEAIKHLGKKSGSFLPAAIELYIHAGRTDSARDCLTELERLQEDVSLTAFYRGMLAGSRQDWPAAAGAYRQSIELGRRSEQVYLKAAGAYMAMDDRTSAIQLLRTFLYQQPDSFEGNLLLGQILADAGQMAESENVLARALGLRPENQRAKLLYLRVQVQRLAANSSADKTSGVGELEKQFDRMLKEQDSLDVRLLMFQTAMQCGRFDEAADILKELQSKYPDEPKITLGQADLLLAQKRTDKAIVALEDAVKRFGQVPELVRTLAAVLVRQKEYERAMKILAEASAGVDDSRQRRQFTFWTADIASLAGDDARAKRLLLDYIGANQPDIMARRCLLNISIKTDSADFLQKHIDWIKQLEGQRGWQWRYEQARLWFRDEFFGGKYPQIISLLTDNLRSNPDDRQSLLLAAASHEKAGNLRLAIAAYEEALSKNPDDTDIVIATIGALYRAEEYRRADEILAKVVSQGLSDPRLRRFELQSCLRQGKLAPAGQILEQMLSESGQNRDVRLSLALLKIRQGQFETVADLIEPILQKEPDFVPAIAIMVQLNLERKKDQDALSLCDQTVSRLKSPAAYNLRCRAYLTLGRVADALRDAQSLENLDKQNSDTLLVCSELYAACGSMDRAVETSRKALAMGPQSFDAQKRAALVLISAGPQRRSAGLELLEQALSQQPTDAQLRLVKSRLLLDKQTRPDQEEAVKLLNDLIYEYPRMEAAWLVLAEWYLSQDMPGRAMDVATRSLSYLPQSDGLLLARARAEAAISENLAIPTLEQIVRQGGDETACALLGRMYLKSGQIDKAQDVLNTCIKEHKHKGYTNVKMVLARVVSEKGDIAGAADIYRGLLAEDSSNPLILLNWVGILADADRWAQIPDFVIDWYKTNPDRKGIIPRCAEQITSFHSPGAFSCAEQVVGRVLAAEPDNPDATLAQAMLMHAGGRTVEAAKMYGRAVELNPGCVVAMNNLAWILCEDENHYQALELANKGLAISPDYVDMLDTRGMIYLALGDYDKALADFRRCLDLYPSSRPQLSATCLRMAKTLLKLGRKDQAVDYLRQAEELNKKTSGLSSVEMAELQSLLHNNMDKESR